MPGSPLSEDPIAAARRQWIAHGWESAAEGMAAVTSVMRAQQIMIARVEQVLRPYQLSFARYELLMLLLFSRGGALPMNKASSRLQVHPTSITNAVDRLQSAGLVFREPHPTDRRTTLIKITDPGRELAGRATEAMNREVFEQPGLPDERLQQLVQTLALLRRDAGDYRDGTGPGA
ncbi:MarR family winged helix-turn-helix transcriptional regulator [Naumannella halotolerans]|nr:MarR family transcriptional regulator [Naumannella halotolerans]